MVYVTFGHRQDDNFAIGQRAGFLLCHWSGCGGSYFAIGQGAGFLICYWSGCGGSYFVTVHIGQSAGCLLCSWSGCDGSQACNSGGQGCTWVDVLLVRA